MKATASAVLLFFAASAHAKVDWNAICTDTGDVGQLCADLDRGATFVCLATKESLGKMTAECKTAVLERNREARQSDSVLWKTECVLELESLCAEKLDSERLPCLGENQSELAQPCLNSLIILQRQQRAPQRMARPPQAQRPVGYAASIRSVEQADMCMGFNDQNKATRLPCDIMDGKQHFSVIQTAKGYSLSVGFGKHCLNHNAELVPCQNPKAMANTYFGLERRADHAVLVKDLNTNKCLGASMTFEDDCETGEDIGWSVDPRFVKYVVKVAPAPTPQPQAPKIYVIPVEAPGKGKGKGKGKRKGKGKGKGKGKRKGRGKGKGAGMTAAAVSP